MGEGEGEGEGEGNREGRGQKEDKRKLFARGRVSTTVLSSKPRTPALSTCSSPSQPSLIMLTKHLFSDPCPRAAWWWLAEHGTGAPGAGKYMHVQSLYLKSNCIKNVVYLYIHLGGSLPCARAKPRVVVWVSYTYERPPNPT